MEVIMHKPAQAFMTILKLELDDLEEDLKQLVEEAEVLHDKKLISNYVYLENLAVIKHELFGINGIVKRFEQTDPDQFENLDDLISSLLAAMLQVKAIELLPEGIIHLVERKMEKVKGYVLC